jgi:Alpha/beta hydrolase domain
MKRYFLAATVASITVAGLLVGAGPSSATAPARTSAAGVPSAVFTKVQVAGTTALAAAPRRLLATYGYVEQEYYVSGTACRYRMTAPLADAQVVDCDSPYKTRMIVRRPADPNRFNGTATVEWSNVSTGQDIDFVWAATHDYQMRHGYASISVSAQLNGVNALKAWSPARYGSLTLAASNTDPQTGSTLDQTGDVLSWDVFSQTVQGLRHPAATNPLPGLRVKRVIAMGESQSALRLTPYYNSIDPLHHVVDGIVYYDAAGALRTDSRTKAISVATEIAIGLQANGLPAADSRNYRRWELAGTSHVSYQDMQYVDPMVLRDGFLKLPDGTPSTLTGLITGCSQSPAWSTVPTGYVLDAAVQTINGWIMGGRPAPTAPRMVRDPSAPPLFDPNAPGGQAPGYAKDAIGNTAGGIHLSEYDYPSAVIKGAGTTGPATCWLTGMHRWFTDQELAARYPDPEAYLRGVKQLARQNVAHGFLLPEDAARTLQDAYIVYRNLPHQSHAS